MKTKTSQTDGKTTTYDYDLNGNLRSIALPNGDTIHYGYDGRNRMVSRTDAGGSIGFIYKDQLNPVATVDASGNIIAEFIYGTKGHVPDTMLKDGKTYRIISDERGSVRLVIDATTGVVAQRLDYDPWGVVTQDTAPGFQPFGYAGGVYDPATGLVRFGARDYDARIGRWLSKDPVEFGGGMNMYQYAVSDPINYIDPVGKKPVITAPEPLWTINEGKCSIIATGLGMAVGGIIAGPGGARGGASLGGALGDLTCSSDTGDSALPPPPPQIPQEQCTPFGPGPSRPGNSLPPFELEGPSIVPPPK